MKNFKEVAVVLMIALITALVVVGLMVLASIYTNKHFEHKAVKSREAIPTERVDMINAVSPTDGGAASFNDLLDAIEQVESGGNANTLGDVKEINESSVMDANIVFHNPDEQRYYEYQAVGAYQIHKIYVDDVNRIQKLWESKSSGRFARQFSYEDRWNKNLSRFMAKTYLKHYGGTFEEMARKHNGGPNGHKKESTKNYWLKVKRILEAK